MAADWLMTASAASDLCAFRINDFELVSLNFTSWNQIASFLRRLDRLRVAALGL